MYSENIYYTSGYLHSLSFTIHIVNKLFNNIRYKIKRKIDIFHN